MHKWLYKLWKYFVQMGQNNAVDFGIIIGTNGTGQKGIVNVQEYDWKVQACSKHFFQQVDKEVEINLEIKVFVLKALLI